MIFDYLENEITVVTICYLSSKRIYLFWFRTTCNTVEFEQGFCQHKFVFEKL